jgi:hypothetical protein
VRQYARQLRGTVIVDPTNPVDFSTVDRLDLEWIGPFGSGGELIAAEAPDGAALVKATSLGCRWQEKSVASSWMCSPPATIERLRRR